MAQIRLILLTKSILNFQKEWGRIQRFLQLPTKTFLIHLEIVMGISILVIQRDQELTFLISGLRGDQQIQTSGLKTGRIGLVPRVNLQFGAGICVPYPNFFSEAGAARACRY